MNVINRHDDSTVEPTAAVELSTSQRQVWSALEQFGYSPREVAFIALAAAHSGCFLKRQWAKFAGAAQDRRASEFLAVLLARGHVRALPFGRDTVYHIGSHAIYRAIGRNRRSIGPFTVTRKLMALDVVLEFQDRVWYGTEQEKVALFTRGFGLDEAILPTKRYRSRRDPQSGTIHRFGECFPVGVAMPAPSPTGIVTIVYVSHSERSTYPFERFMLAYAPLVGHLPAVVVLYVSTGGNWGTTAQAVFTRHYGSASSDGQPPVPARLEAHFRSRRRLEQGQIADVTEAEMKQLQSDLARFRGARYDRLYHSWQSNQAGLSSRTPRPALEIYHLPFTYPAGAALEHPALTQLPKRDRESFK